MQISDLQNMVRSREDFIENWSYDKCILSFKHYSQAICNTIMCRNVQQKSLPSVISKTVQFTTGYTKIWISKWINLARLNL